MSSCSVLRTAHGRSKTRSSQVRIPALLGRLSAGALEPLELAQDSGADAFGHPVAELVELGSVVLGRSVFFAQFLADRSQLLAEQVVALRLLHALSDVVADLGADVQLAEEVLGPTDDELQSRSQLGQFEHGQAVIGTGVGPCGDGVSELAGVRHGTQDLGQTTRAPDLGNAFGQRPQFAAECLDPRCRPRFGQRLDGHPLTTALAGLLADDEGSRQGADDDHPGAVGQLGGLLDRADHTDMNRPAVDLGKEEQLSTVVRCSIGGSPGSGESRVMVTTTPGNATAPGSGSTGRVVVVIDCSAMRARY